MVEPDKTQVLEARLERFELAWQSDSLPEISEFLAAAPESLRGELLVELVKIDLEFRWRRFGRSAEASQLESSLPARACLEDYTRQYPELGPADRLAVDSPLHNVPKSGSPLAPFFACAAVVGRNRCGRDAPAFAEKEGRVGGDRWHRFRITAYQCLFREKTPSRPKNALPDDDLHALSGRQPGL